MASFPLVFFVTVLSMTDYAQGQEGHCVWYGVCQNRTVHGTNKDLNCAVNFSAPNVHEQPNGKESLRLIKQLCPWMYSGDTTTRTCCNYQQLVNLKAGTDSMNSLLGTCPSCSHSFMKLFCAYTCAPDQSLFMRVNSTTKMASGGVAINSIDVKVAPIFRDELYGSCENVKQGKALRTVCQAARNCNPSLLLENLGSSSYSPFPINFTFDAEKSRSIQPRDFGAVPCSEPAPGQSEPCTCEDCPIRKGCRGTPPVTKQSHSFMVSMDGVAFIMICLYIAFLFLFLAALSCNSETESKSLDQTTEVIRIFPVARWSKLSSRMQLVQELYFRKWASFCAQNSKKVIVIGLLVVVVLTSGAALLKVTSDPVKLWSSPRSEVRKEKGIFDENFGPFYRTEQLVITVDGLKEAFHHNKSDGTTCFKDQKTEYGSIFRKDIMEKILQIQLHLMTMEVPFRDESGHENNITLEDLCFKPLKPYNNRCAIQSVFQYFQNDLKNFQQGGGYFCTWTDYLDHIKTCTENPYIVDSRNEDSLPLSCLADYGGPALPNVILGGYNGLNYTQAKALVITFLLNNHVDDEKNAEAKAWEKAFLKYIQSVDTHLNFSIFETNSSKEIDASLNIAYMAERSVADEVARESKSDVLPILVSYCIMFLYVATSLGRFTSKHSSMLSILIDSKIFLAMSGVLMVLAAIGMSLGIFALAGVEATLIVFEVVPFLVLAIGVDNIFIMAQSLQRDAKLEHENVAMQVGRVVGGLGPGLALTALSESVAFFCGAFSSMPAVKTFSLYAGMAVLVNYILQMTVFTALLTLDARRQIANRLDCCCCVTVRKTEAGELYSTLGLIYRLLDTYLAPTLLNKYVRPAVVAVFVGCLFSSVMATTKLEIGLNQATPLPKDSYLVDYFRNQSMYLRVGPPVYFVVDGEYPYDELKYQSQICSQTTCSNDSLVRMITEASKSPQVSLIAMPPMSWLDDYLQWISPLTGCCRHYSAPPHSFCNASEKQQPCTDCMNRSGPPSKDTFNKEIRNFLADNPTQFCPKAGHAAYGHALSFVRNMQAEVKASYFMTYHTILSDSSDYIDALRFARGLADRLTTRLNHPGVRVFPYSIFYVYYGQYLTIIHDAAVNLTISAMALFIVSLFLFSLRLLPAFLILLTVIMIVVNQMGVMYLWNIKLNAVSLVNLIVAMGIAVEFCGHIVSKFTFSRSGTRIERAREALVNTGSSVFSGITLTKFAGVTVLAFTNSELFQIYYFRMYLSIVLIGAAHGLIFIPVLLSYVGPQPVPNVLPSVTSINTAPNERSPLLHSSSMVSQS